MKLVLVSDTHEQHDRLGVLEGDVLIHCGDHQQRHDPDPAVVGSLDAWFARQRFRHILAIGGNHDFALFAGATLEHATVLEDAAVTLDGLRFWGAPWTPDLPGWAFYQDDAGMQAKWDRIPPDTDVLITHTPPFRILDRPTRGGHLGCRHLRAAVERIQPRLHVFGHVHASGGTVEHGPTQFVNAACLHRGGFRGPVVVDLPTGD
jgi:Icc-related predicted phosphoesterase